MESPIVEIKNPDAPVRKLKLIWDGVGFKVVNGLEENEQFTTFHVDPNSQDSIELHEWMFEQWKGVRWEFIFVVEGCNENYKITKIYSTVPIEYEIEYQKWEPTSQEVAMLERSAASYDTFHNIVEDIVEKDEQQER